MGSLPNCWRWIGFWISNFWYSTRLNLYLYYGYSFICPCWEIPTVYTDEFQILQIWSWFPRVLLASIIRVCEQGQAGTFTGYTYYIVIFSASFCFNFAATHGRLLGSPVKSSVTSMNFGLPLEITLYAYQNPKNLY